MLKHNMKMSARNANKLNTTIDYNGACNKL